MNAATIESAISVISDWQGKLEANQEAIFRVRRVRREQISVENRLYTFLLKTYGDGRWRCDAGDEPQNEQSRGAGELDVPASFDGKPPKSSARMLSALKHAKSSLDSVPICGPYRDGLHYGDWIVVTSAADHISPSKVERLLASCSLEFRTRLLGDSIVILVRMCDRRKAMGLIRTYRHSLRPPRRSSVIYLPKDVEVGLLRGSWLLLLNGLFTIGLGWLACFLKANTASETFLLSLSALYIGGWCYHLTERWQDSRT